MRNNAVYENDSIRCVTGETLRPGGFFLTKRAILTCGLRENQKVLDVGCGMGATVNLLKDEYGIEAFGIDSSEKLVQLGKEKKGLQLTIGKGESLPYENCIFDAVFAECTLSLMDNFEKAIEEIYRVLKGGGFFIATDVYARCPEYIDELKKTQVKSCLRNLFELGTFLRKIEYIGFEILALEDWTSLLKKLMVEIIFKYGSMAEFWKVTTCCNCGDFQERLTLCKPGYFLLIAKKEDE